VPTDPKQRSVIVTDAPAGDPISAIVSDNVAAQARFLAMFPSLTGRQVVEMGSDRGVDGRPALSRWTLARQILALRVAGELVYPAFQFRDGKPRPVIACVLAALPKRKSDWQVAFWFASSSSWLDGMTPIARLDDADAVVEAARHEAEDIVG
jgi:hypothetical protein